jgi:16S rRNA (cytidine1402-2'-O)-methyltransferase
LNSTGILYLVATPIGNLGDITFRAIEVLKSADKVLAEDTRTTRVLFQHYHIETRLESFHQHNEHARLKGIVQELLDGAVIAQVSDAGTPGISDPGFLLARACLEQGVKVEVIPGATAFIPALIKSGFALHNFVFEGFLPLKKGRQTKMQQMAQEERTLVFYESPHKLLKTLQQFSEICTPERRASVSREITKKFEETVTGTFPDLIAHFTNRAPKGEFVVVLEGLNQHGHAE